MLTPTPEPTPAGAHVAIAASSSTRKTRLVWRRKRLIELALSALVILLTIALLAVVAYIWLQGVTAELPPCTDEIAKRGGICSGPIRD